MERLLKIGATAAAIQYSLHTYRFLSAEMEGLLFGYGLIAILFGLFEVVLLLQLASLALQIPDKI